MTTDLPSEVPLDDPGGGPRARHLFEPESIWAIHTALAANRPLLIRGEPGVGKSQLARAAAIALARPFLSLVVNARTEPHDLMASFDAVQRLARAQLCAALPNPDPKRLKRLLAERRFLYPGKLWWAFDWASAQAQAKLVGGPTPDAPPDWKPGAGCVLLVDEIDKAESDLPNGLLEALGSRSFPVRGRKAVVQNVGEPPLVVITTNEERVLPDAFVRRCLVYHLRLPPSSELAAFLIQRGQAHLPKAKKAFLKEAAELLVAAREAAIRDHSRPLPGQAEYLDMIRAADHIARTKGADPKDLLQNVKNFVLKKNAGRPG